MEPIVILMVAGSAVLHVAWNVRLKEAGDPLTAAAIGLAVGALVIVPGARPPGGSAAPSNSPRKAWGWDCSRA